MIRQNNKCMAVIIATIITLVTLSPFSYSQLHASEKKSNSKVIYVIFDNSGSMYENNNLAWSQATYAIQVFASMLNYNNGDKMVIKTMHGVKVGKNGKSIKTIKIGSDKDAKKIREIWTENAGGTPYNPVTEAKKAIEKEKQQEKWLVIMTDGAFDAGIPKGGEQKDLEKFANAKKGKFVQYLRIGSSDHKIKGSPEKGFYADNTTNSSDVISKLAKISNRIFRRNEIENYKSGDLLKFDVPISKVIVFAQGAKVQIKSLKEKGGKSITKQSDQQVQSPDEQMVHIHNGTAKRKSDKSLKGIIATFAGSESISPGDYVLDVKRASQVSVYYETDVDFAIELYDAGGKIKKNSTIEAGEYTLKVGFVNRATGDFIKKSKTIGMAKYHIEGVEKPIDREGKDGATVEEKVVLKKGEYCIKGTVNYLADYRNDDSGNYKVKEKDTSVSISLDTDYQKDKLRDLEKNSVTATVFLNKKPISEEIWKNMEFPKISTESNIDFEIVRGSKASTFVIKPKYYKGDIKETDTGKISYKITAKIQSSIYKGEGSTDGELEIEDDLRKLSIQLETPKKISLKELQKKENDLKVTILRDGKPLSEKEWNELEISAESNEKIGFKVERGEEISTYKIHLKYYKNDMFKTSTGKINVRVDASGILDDVAVKGETKDNFEIKDNLSLLDKIKHYWKQILFWGIIILLILGYLPPFKKRLPKRMKKSPTINCSANKAGLHDVRAHGRYKKNLLSVILPYKAVTGTLTFSPSPVRKTANIRAAGSGGIYITNVKKFAGHNEILFNGMAIEEGRTKPYRISAASPLSVMTPEYNYTCYPNT